jgi:hypothetical protein
MTRYCLGHEETSAKVCIKYQIPVIPRNVEGRFAHVAAGVVYENVDTTKGLFCRGCKALNTFAIANIQFEGNGAATERLNLRLKRREVRAIPAGENDIGTCFGEGPGEVLSEAAAGASYNRNPAS